MKKSIRCVVIAFAVFIATSAFAQEWTAAQKEVWKVVEDSWTKWKEGDMTGALAPLHEKYQGWASDVPLPMTKDQVQQWYKEMKDIMKVESFFLSPARILVTENAAVVDYYYEFYATYTLGEKKQSKDLKGKNAEFYIKEDGKWMLLGDMTVHENQEKEED